MLPNVISRSEMQYATPHLTKAGFPHQIRAALANREHLDRSGIRFWTMQLAKTVWYSYKAFHLVHMHHSIA